MVAVYHATSARHNWIKFESAFDEFHVIADDVVIDD